MDERIHRWLAVVAVAIALIGFIGWRSLGSADPRRASPSSTPVPSPNLSQLIEYSAPLSDTVRYVASRADSIVIPRDPFVSQSVARIVRAVRAAEGAPAPTTDLSQWRVTMTLMAGSRRAAVINDALVYVGDPLPGGGKLTSVQHDRVIVTDSQGVSHTVAVKEGTG